MTYRHHLLLSTAAAALICGAMSAKGYAADLGGNCCGDLEERVAELEATTARKGNRVVSLEISGQVNRALLIWDDGSNSDAYVVDPDSDGSRFRFVGKAQIKPGWTAGYILELTTVDSASNAVSQVDDEGAAQPINIRQNGWFMESERLGRLSMGQLSQPTDGINEIDVVGTKTTVAKTHYAGNFFVNNLDGAYTANGVRWQDILGAIGGGQDDIIRYDTPSIYGFIFSAAWGDNDVWDVAVHFEKQFNSVKIVGGIGYLDDQRDNRFGQAGEFQNGNQLSGSISAQHVPSGLFATFAAGRKEFDDKDLSDAENWYVKGGISKNWFGYGATTLFVDYAHFNGFGEGRQFNLDSTSPTALANDTLTSSEASVWGFGVVQSIDAASLDIYALAQFFSSDLEGTFNGGTTVNDVSGDDHMAIVIGSHIKF
jgi:hypothetical protein